MSLLVEGELFRARVRDRNTPERTENRRNSYRILLSVRPLSGSNSVPFFSFAELRPGPVDCASFQDIEHTVLLSLGQLIKVSFCQVYSDLHL